VGLRERPTRSVSLVGAMAVSMGLAALPNAAELGQPHPTAAPIVSLGFDNVSGALWKATPGSLARSLDEGLTWIPVVLPIASRDGIASLTISAGRSKTIYVAIVGAGVLHSYDGGRSWLVRNQGLPSLEVLALAAHSTQPRTVYANVGGKGIFRSRDAGATWHLVDRGPAESVVQLVHSSMPSKSGTGWLFAATSKGVRRTMDCFCGWQSAGAVRLNFRVVASDAGWPTRLYAAAREGLFISPDGGDHWLRTREPYAAITALASTPSGRLYGAINGKLIKSVNRGITWEYTVR
jgi:photosystem II stability/assembly factor-like uncharacterized protein